MSNSALGSHKRWHKEKKLLRSSPKDDDLKSLSHKTESGPFQCNKCGKQFFNHCVLQRHQMFNSQCQIKPELESESDKITRSSSNLRNPAVSLLTARNVDEQSKTHLQGAHPSLAESVQEQVDINVYKCESVSSNVKHKVHQCPLCSLTFAKARGLRAHRWQVHSKGTQSRSNVILSVKKPVALTMHSGDFSVVENAVVENNPVSRGEKKIKMDLSPVKSISCLSSVKQTSTAAAIFNHKKVGMEGKHGSKEEIPTPDTPAEIPPPVGRLSEHTAKCLFKCDKCGKAFQTEEQLGGHKAKAKSRPYCCALCCQGFWTESQLQQHLAWHDEVRCRLPNEVRFRLSAALTSKPLKPNLASAGTKGKSCPIKADSLLQNSHKCQHCGKAFLSPSALQKHETQHCNDSYHCSICPRTFSEIQDLIDHHQECIGDYKKLNDAPAAASSGDTTGLTCLVCGTTFCQETDFHQHCTEHGHGVF